MRPTNNGDVEIWFSAAHQSRCAEPIGLAAPDWLILPP